MDTTSYPDRDVADLKANCDQEPVHLPGSIQPHGVLLVVRPDEQIILQAAGDPGCLLGILDDVQGKPLAEVLGASFIGLTVNSWAELRREPTYIGTINAPWAAALTVTAHLVDGVAVVELEPAVETRAAPLLLAAIRSITERIGDADDLVGAAQLAVDEVQAITGYDRVMAYRFLADGSGSVVAEIKPGDWPAFLHHRFPASDIPTQARDLYRRSPIRVISDVDYVAAPLLPVSIPTTDGPLDMSHCALRSVSPVHIKYLKNMGVGASMSVSLLVRNELWGLIACHNVIPRPVGYEARELCKHVAQILARKTEALAEADAHRLSRDLGSAADGLLRELLETDDPASVLLAQCAALQAVVRAGGVAIIWRESVATAGKVPAAHDLDALAAWLKTRLVGGELFTSFQLSEQYPPASRFEHEGSGLLSILLQGDDPPLLIWFRAEQVQEINWAGNLNETLDPNSRLGALNPRRSFATWIEMVRGRSRPWRTVEIETLQSFGRRLAPLLQQQRVRELNMLLRKANDKLAALAATDKLTGLANRRAFDERLEYECSRALGFSTPLSLITLDLDFFKQYNDHFGHPEGDACLRQVSRVIAAGRRSTDVTARVGGEEFSILLPETDLDEALVIAEKMRSRIQALQLNHPRSSFGMVTASIGVAVEISTRGSTGKDLIQAADTALYAAKDAGRNQVASACRSREGQQNLLSKPQDFDAASRPSSR